MIVVTTLLAACADSGTDAAARAGSSTSTTSASTTTVDLGATTSSSAPPAEVDADRPAPSTSTTAAAVRPAGGPLPFTLDLPPGWSMAGPQLGTEFAQGAECAAAVVVDRDVPPDAGASVERSVVQVCWRPRGGATLGQFMADTYGPDLGGFEPTTLAGHPAYAVQRATSSTWFADGTQSRYQVATSVEASPALEGARLGDVDRILSSLTLS